MPSESHGTHDQTPAEREEALVRKAVMERINEAYRPKPGFASEVGANAFDYALIDLRAALAPKEGAPTADLGRAVGAWAEIAEHYRCAMLAAETAINSTPMPVSDGQTSLIWKRFSEAATGLHTARMDMIHKYGPAFLNSGPIGPAALPAQAAEAVAVKALREAYEHAKYQPGDYPIVPVKMVRLLEELERFFAGSALSGAAPQAGEGGQ